MAIPLLGMRFARALAVGAVLAAAGVRPAAQSPADLESARKDFEQGKQIRDRGNPIGATPYLQRAIAVAERGGDPLLLQKALDAMASVRGDLNDWAGSLDYAQRAYDAAPDANGVGRLQYLSSRGRVLQELRERDQAFAAYREGLALAEKRGDEDALIDFYNELGLATWRLDRDRAGALKYYDAGIELSLRTNDHRGAMVIYNNSGNLFRNPGNYPEAERRYRLGMAAAERLGITEGDPFLLKNMGIVYRETGRRTEAKHLLERAIALADARGQGRIQWQGRMELGTFHAATDPKRAADLYEQTLTALEGLNNSVLLEGFRAGALSGAVTIYDDPYDLYTDLLLNTGDDRGAFFVAERARARAFLDTLSLAREAIAESLPEDFVRSEREILARISTNQADLRAGGIAAERRRAAEAAIAADEEALTRLRVRLAAEHPAMAHARYPRLWSVDDVQQQLLTGDEVLLQYFLGANAGTLWAITTSGVHVRKLAPRAEIESAVRSYLDVVGRPGTDFKSAATSMAGLLLPDLEQVIAKGARLIVVPHGVLSYVPFETLMRGNDGRFLIMDHPISYAPSTSSLGFLRTRRSSGHEVLAIGNALMRNGDAAAERGQSLASVGALKPLVHSGPEVRAVSRVYGASAHVFEQEAATELVLTGTDAARAGIIHIATHGVFDEDMPERSGLALSAAPPSDGILQMREVYRLRLNAALVTLSACQTALGKVITGEGLVGLSRAFFYAGSNAVLASLWNVNDASTARLMQPFYERLADGAAIDEALRTAKLDLLETGGRLAHPYYWAAFVVTGHGSAHVPVRPEHARFPWLPATALALLAAGSVFIWRRVR